jgi:hypothetical protein
VSTLENGTASTNPINANAANIQIIIEPSIRRRVPRVSRMAGRSGPDKASVGGPRHPDHVSGIGRALVICVTVNGDALNLSCRAESEDAPNGPR